MRSTNGLIFPPPLLPESPQRRENFAGPFDPDQLARALGIAPGLTVAELAERAIYTCYEFALTRRLARLGDTVTLQCCDTGTRIGTFPRAPEVSGTANELLRTLAGRRTRAEADEALDWGDASLDARHLFPVYGWPT